MKMRKNLILALGLVISAFWSPKAQAANGLSHGDINAMCVAAITESKAISTAIYWGLVPNNVDSAITANLSQLKAYLLCLHPNVVPAFRSSIWPMVKVGAASAALGIAGIWLTYKGVVILKNGVYYLLGFNKQPALADEQKID